MKNDIQVLLKKFILNECTPKEVEEVITYVKKINSDVQFPTVEEVSAMLKEIPEIDDKSANVIYDQIMVKVENQKLKSEKKTNVQRKSYRRYAAVAAVCMAFLSIGYLYRQSNPIEIVENITVPVVEVVTLQLENGDIKVMTDGVTAQVADAEGNIIGEQIGAKLVYGNKTVSEKLVFNTLTVPYGRRFELLLSDGTRVHLNAGSSLKYPVKFLEQGNRRVFLSGEAFFDVARNEEHPFIVSADKLNIRVLGTKFNMSTYAEDIMSDVVLVEGSVGMYTEGENFDAEKNTILKPGYKGSYDKTEKNISTEPVMTSIYTSWMKGELVLRYMSFEKILKKMERYYNVTIVNENVELADVEFNASFHNVPIQRILEYFKIHYAMDFSIDNDKILIK